jgi:hypothetical protein
MIIGNLGNVPSVPGFPPVQVKPKQVLTCHIQVQVTEDVAVRPCAVAVIVAVAVPVPQVKLQTTVAVFAKLFPTATPSAAELALGMDGRGRPSLRELCRDKTFTRFLNLLPRLSICD